jgi:hypothetical protein
MASLDHEIDRLYQLPRSEFTKARDELARRDASHSAAIRRLQKPSLPAWAVNQLYWRDRGCYEALAAAADRLRKVHVATLAGKADDVARAEADHQTARKAATDRIRAILTDAGETATAATLTAINETLQALPTTESSGRLVRPLKPMGFEGFAGLLKTGRIASPRADVLAFRKPSPPREAAGKAAAAKRLGAETRQAEKDARRQIEERKKQASKLTARLREAEAGERAANTALTRARSALAKAEQDHQAAAARAEATAARVEALNREVRAGERHASQTAIARADLEGQLKAVAGDPR